MSNFSRRTVLGFNRIPLYFFPDSYFLTHNRFFANIRSLFVDLYMCHFPFTEGSIRRRTGASVCWLLLNHNSLFFDWAETRAASVSTCLPIVTSLHCDGF